jgi:hypothetical protein
VRVGRRHLREQRGAVLVFLAISLPVLLSIGALVISVGNWFTHGKHLQTKVDAAAFAGGGAWSFPCSPDADASIAAEARQYVGDHTAADSSLVTGSFNPQIGGVGGSDVYVALNQADWWDSGFGDVDFSDPQGSVCESMILDVKATEDDSPPLWGWLPIWPDIKRKARVEIRQIFGLTRPLPIAVRVPKPSSVAAVFYNEANGAIFAARYFREDDSVAGVPAGLEGWTTRPDDSEQWPQFMPATSTGVLIAMSFLPKCPRSPQCFDIDTGTYPTVNSLCNQGPTTQSVSCFDASGSYPSASAESGLHFIRGYADTSPGTGPPGLESSYLANITCPSGGAYFSSHPTTGCEVKLHVALNLGALQGTYPNPPNPPVTEALHAGDVEVRYRLVREDGTSSCDYGAQCDLIGSGSGPNVTFSTQGDGDSPHLPIAAGSGGNAVAIQVRIRNAVNSPNPACSGDNFNNNCRWFYTGTGVPSPDVPPTDLEILAAPVQRSYLGNLDRSGPVYWLRLSADPDCDASNGYLEEPLNPEAASRRTSTCFAVDMGLKGGRAKDQDEFAFAFNEGTGSSQMGSLDCDPSIPQGQMLTDGVQFGCSPWYRKNGFDSSPLCPAANELFNDPNPGPPFDDWPPLECVKTRPTGSMNQLLEGLNLRLFGDGTNPECPIEEDPTKFYPGRNYWHNANNQNDTWTYYDDRGTPTTADDLRNRLNPDDPRLVYLFFTPYNTFTGSGQEVFPLVGLGGFYITGYGRLNGSGGFQGGAPEDPCDDGNVGPLDGYPAGVGNEPPPDLINCGGSCSGTVVWGHFLVPVDSSGGSTPSEEPCDPDESFTPCRPVLVE